ncbi:hypothetical protein [Acidipropionibacterium virtanenii]|nr:hypothetical protein [Acidipropionibacterium virtanenii]
MAEKYTHASDAGEFLEQLSNDKDYQARERKAERERAQRERDLAEAESPILADLRGVGYDVTSIYFLSTKYEIYSAALPVIFRHLERGGYPGSIMGHLARLMGVKEARPYWDRLRGLYETHTTETQLCDGLADALGRSAGKEQFDGLVELLLDDSRDGVRVMFIPDIIRVGREQGWKVVESVADDPVLGKEASYRLHQRDLRRRAKARREARRNR